MEHVSRPTYCVQHQRLQQPGQLAADGGIADIYMPDLKIWTTVRVGRYLRMPGYPQAARHCHRDEMHRQVGLLRSGGDGLALRGLLMRHLMMSAMVQETRAILRYVA
jgi:putative pyruvate formate lyase activating enzyme